MFSQNLFHTILNEHDLTNHSTSSKYQRITLYTSKVMLLGFLQATLKNYLVNNSK